MADWVNRTLVQGPRNGTNSHTVTFAPATAGNLLVAIAYGSATSTTPTGWTLPTGGSAINNGGLYFWYKTATSGESSFSTTHNGTNYPINFLIYEFPSGSTFGVAAANANNANNAATPALSGQTGTAFYMAFAGMATSGTAGTSTANWSTGTKDSDVLVLAVAGDGHAFSNIYVSGSASATFAPSVNFVTTGISSINHEGIVVRLTVPATGTTTLDAVKSGSTTVGTAYVGTTGVSKMYAGTVQVFP